MKPSAFPREAKFHTAGPPLRENGTCYVRDHVGVVHVELHPEQFSRDMSYITDTSANIHSAYRGYWLMEDIRADGLPGQYSKLHDLVAGFFTPEAVRRMATIARQQANDTIDLLDTSRPWFDLGDWAYGVAFRAICFFLGLPENSEAFARKELMDFVDRDGFDLSPESVSFRRFLENASRRRPEHDPGNDLLGRLIVALQQSEITLENFRGYLAMFFAAGIDMGTTLVNMFALLDEFGLLSEAHANLNSPRWINHALEETVRFMPSFSQGSTIATENTALPDGTQVPAGTHVVMCYAAANRDPHLFDRPDEFIVERSPNPHLGFGHGRHYCTGAPLARAVIPAAFATLLWRLPHVRLHPNHAMFLRHSKATDWVEATAVFDPARS